MIKLLLKRFWPLIFIIPLLFASLYYRSQYHQAVLSLQVRNSQIEILNHQLNEQNAAVLQLKNMSDEQSRKLATAQQKAAEQNKDAQQKVAEILNANVPTECLAAIRWGAEQGPLLVAS